MIDIDYFKTYNDTYGHLQGDNVLVEVARTLKQLSRAPISWRAMAGKSLPSSSPKPIKPMLKPSTSAAEYVEQHTFPGAAALPTKALTISVGIASYTPPDTKEVLIEAADVALYHAKREGRNRVVVWQRSMTLQPHSDPS